LESYNQFAQSVKTDSRYVRSKLADAFLAEVVASCTSRAIVVPANSVFWRARLGCEYEEVTRTEDDFTVAWEEDRPFRAQEMKPIPNWQGEGRANPRGIPCLYVATTRETALAEVRPWIGATISVARLQTVRALNLIDCSKYHAPNNSLEVYGSQTLSRQDGQWIAIDRSFATPVSKDLETKEYIPTQILAELFKSRGYDGIVYKSLLSKDGFNLAIFNLNDADVIHCALFHADSISFDFRDSGSEYFTGPKSPSKSEKDVKS
jgi:hypothetical protein